MIREKKMLRKMGYRRGENLNMDIKDIVELGKMGYTKEEIEALRTEEKAAVPDEIQTQLDNLSGRLDAITQEAQKAAARQTASTTDPGDPGTQNVDDILLKMSMGENNG